MVIRVLSGKLPNSMSSKETGRDVAPPRTLSKSRFKLALECPTKVHYSYDNRYVNTKDGSGLLESLAFGGFQVGELAKAMYRAEDPDAIEIGGGQTTQIAETAMLLQRENVTLFEATFLHDNLLARVDILKKRGTVLDLIEVKSTAWDPEEHSLVGSSPRSDPVTPKWRPYVLDLAFQQHLLLQALPTVLGTVNFTLRPWLLLPNKATKCSINGLAFNFPVVGKGQRLKATTLPGFDPAILDQPLLTSVDATQAVLRVFQNEISRRQKSNTDFHGLIRATSSALKKNERIYPEVGEACKSCEFYADPHLTSDERRSGWTECMTLHFKQPQVPRRDQSIFGLYRRSPIRELIENNRLWLKDVAHSELPEPMSDTGPITLEVRHRLQREEALGNAGSVVIDRATIERAFSSLKFPLHFIDFETVRPALPYYRNHHPHQLILFQFSHHIVDSDGRVWHASEFLEYSRERSPSLSAVRALRDALVWDTGSVLHWYPHERTVLQEIAAEIDVLDPPDALELRQFLNELGLTKDSGRLFDFGRLLDASVFLPGTGGSSSMKRILPAVLNNSKTLQEKYSKPIYGSAQIPSKNFREMVWIRYKDGAVQDPYTLLQPVFPDSEVSGALEALGTTEGSIIANGAAAMMAFEKLVSDPDKYNELDRQLRRYCELDTLGIIFIYEWLKGLLGSTANTSR